MKIFDAKVNIVLIAGLFASSCGKAPSVVAWGDRGGANIERPDDPKPTPKPNPQPDPTLPDAPDDPKKQMPEKPGDPLNPDDKPDLPPPTPFNPKLPGSGDDTSKKATAVSLVLKNNKKDEKTAQFVGISAREEPVTSNQFLFFEHLGVNQVREFVGSDNEGQAEDGRDLQGRKITSLTTLREAIADLSENYGKETPNPLNIKDFEKPLDKSGAYYDRLHEKGIGILLQYTNPSTVVIEAKQESNDKVYYAQIWESYKYHYMLTRWALRHNARRFEIQNEPDLVDKKSAKTKTDWIPNYLIRLKTASLAIRNASNDAKAGDIAILGPTTAHSPENLDELWMVAYTAILKANKEHLLDGTSNPKWRNFTTLTYHKYSKPGIAYKNLALNILEAVKKISGETYPLAITEFNSHTNGEWDKIKTTSADTIEEAVKFAEQATFQSQLLTDITAFSMASYANAVDFPMSQVQKNGIHWIDTNDPNHNIGGVTRSAEAYRLFAKATAGALPVYDIVGGRDGLTRQLTADENYFYLLLINKDPDILNHQIDVSALTIAKGARVVVEEVSIHANGEVADVPKLDAKGMFHYIQEGQSVTLMTIPRAKSAGLVMGVAPSESANLKAGDKSKLVDTDKSVLKIGTDSKGNNNETSVGLISFDLNEAVIGAAAKSVPFVLLNLTIKQSGNVPADIHVYGFDEASWNGKTITWSEAPFLLPLPADRKVNAVAKNFVNYLHASDPVFLGTISVDAQTRTGAVKGLDVTKFARSGKTKKTFLLVREFRTNGNESRTPAADSLLDSNVTFFGTGAAEDLRPAIAVIK